MARLFTTGAETGAAEYNGATSLSYTPTASSSVKRTGSYSYQFANATVPSVNATFRQVFDDNQTELFGRVALYTTSSTSVNTFNVVSFRDSLNAQQFALKYDAGTQTIGWVDGANTTLAIGNCIVPSSTWVVIEFHVVIDASGTLTCKINGTTDAQYSGDTDYTNVGDVRSVYMGYSYISGSTSSPVMYLDDIAINNADGSYQNSWVGLGGVFYLEPTADGDQNDWTPSSGTVNYAMVDDIPPDNATTYNQGLSNGEIELYEVDDCPEYIASINLVEVVYRAALVTSGYNELTDLVKVNGTVYSGTPHTIVPITPSFTYYKGSVSYLNPNTGTVWGTAEVNAMQAGVNITA